MNSGTLETRGMDIAVNWTADIGDGGGSFYINSLVTFLDEFKIQDAAGEPMLDVRDTLSTSYYGAQYKYKLNNTFGYNFANGRARLGLNWRYLPDDPSETLRAIPPRRSSAPRTTACSACPRASRSTIGSSSAAASTTCSTRIR